jgi:glycosyltransferase involved in cell wall biosynthesis
LLLPSFHDSAGFVVSEALSVGLPVVCLDHGGPGTLVKLWPRAEHVAVRPGSARTVVADLAQAVRDFAMTPRPVPAAPVPACRSLVDVLAAAYDSALCLASGG